MASNAQAWRNSGGILKGPQLPNSRDGSLNRTDNRNASAIPGIQVEGSNPPRIITGRDVPASPCVDSTSVPSVSSDYVILSPYTNPASSYSTNLASPYTNPASYSSSPYTPYTNAERSHTPFNPLEDNIQANENTLRLSGIRSALSPGAATSNPKKRNSGPGNQNPPQPQLTQLLNNGPIGHYGPLSVIENSGPPSNKRVKSNAEPELNEDDILENVLDLMDEQRQRSDERSLLTDEDMPKADSHAVDAYVLKNSLQFLGGKILQSSTHISPETAKPTIQKMTKFANIVIPAWDEAWNIPPQSPFPPPNGGRSTANSNGSFGYANMPSATRNNSMGYGYASPAQVQGNFMDNSRNGRQTPQMPQHPTPPYSPDVVMDGLGLQHPVAGPSNQLNHNYFQAGAPNLQRAPQSQFSAPSNYGYTQNMNQSVPFRNNQITLYAAPAADSFAAQGNESVMMSRQPISMQTFPPPPGNYNRVQSDNNIRIMVGTTPFTISHNDWADVTQTTTRTKMVKAIFDKLFTQEERLSCTISGRKSKLACPALDPCKMLALYACVAYRTIYPNQFPVDSILSSEYTLSDQEKKKIKQMLAQKLNADKQRHGRQNETS